MGGSRQKYWGAGPFPSLSSPSLPLTSIHPFSSLFRFSLFRSHSFPSLPLKIGPLKYSYMVWEIAEVPVAGSAAYSVYSVGTAEPEIVAIGPRI